MQTTSPSGESERDPGRLPGPAGENGGSPLAVRGRVLVVDDEPDIGDILTAALGRVGYAVQAVLDDRLDPIDLTALDLALVDMYGPAHDGKEVIRRIRHEAPRVAVIAMSGDPSIARRDAPIGAAQVGADAVLIKPFEIKDVVELCASLIRRRPTTGP